MMRVHSSTLHILRGALHELTVTNELTPKTRKNGGMNIRVVRHIFILPESCSPNRLSCRIS